MKIFVFGSSILSSYWNGAATYYRGIYKSLAERGHSIIFAEPDAYGRQQHIDSGDYSYVQSVIYEAGDALSLLESASLCDVVIKHSGIGVDDEQLEQCLLELQPECLVIFWDVDAPATLGRLNANRIDQLRNAIPQYDAIFTYGGGPRARQGYLSYGAQAYYSIYNGLDADTHYPVPPDRDLACDLAFVGNRLPDREARVEDLFLAAAEACREKTFVLGGEGWQDKPLPPNVRLIGHVPTGDHNRINCSARMVININRSSMADFGFSPPTRVFEAAGAGACLLCDEWPGIADFFEPESEILIVRSADDVISALNTLDALSCEQIGAAFRTRALRDHAYAQRALQAEQALQQCFNARRSIIQFRPALSEECA